LDKKNYRPLVGWSLLLARPIFGVHLNFVFESGASEYLIPYPPHHWRIPLLYAIDRNQP
jgi:hypothetical protein